MLFFRNLRHRWNEWRIRRDERDTVNFQQRLRALIVSSEATRSRAEINPYAAPCCATGSGFTRGFRCGFVFNSIASMSRRRVRNRWASLPAWTKDGLTACAIAFPLWLLLVLVLLVF